MRKAVILQTDNHDKLCEFRDIFGRHGVEVIQAPFGDVTAVNFQETAQILIAQHEPRHEVVGVLCEESNLFHTDQVEPVDHFYDGQIIENRTRLRALSRAKVGAAYEERNYSAVVPGFIDLTREQQPQDGSSVFGWDNVFVSAGTQMSLHEMRQKGLKLSGRNRVLESFIRDHLHFDAHRDLVTFPQHPERTVDFNRSVIDFFQNNPYLHNPHIHNYGISNLMIQALNHGTFFRAASNRREAIYWSPGGNGGLPLTPKKNWETGVSDEIHEITFFCHDLLHHTLLPDLVYEGTRDPLDIRIAMIWRMMSEALTLVGADMLFVDSLKRSDIKYDFSQRNIYPLFQSLQRDFSNDPATLRELYFANVRYALRGDDSGFVALGADPELLEKYKNVYKRFFIADYQWTARNMENMQKDAVAFERWSTSVAPLAEELKEYLDGRITINECRAWLAQHANTTLETLDVDKLVELIFQFAWEHMIAPAVSAPPVPIDAEHAQKSSFLKYMIAQMKIFNVFDFVPESDLYRQRIIRYIQQSINTLSLEDITRIRGHYNQFVDILIQRDTITTEDADIYKEIFPHFPPMYVAYNETPDSKFKDLAIASTHFLNAQ